MGTAAPGPNPPTAAPPAPGIFISSSAFLPAAAMAAQEIDALSFGHDEPGGRLYFAVDKFARGSAGPAAADLVAEIVAREASADVFSSANANPLSGAGPIGNRAVFDGDGSSRPGLGLLEPNPLYAPGTYPDRWPDAGDNIDALDVGTRRAHANGFIYFSLDGDALDPLRTTEWIPTVLLLAGGVWAHPGYNSACQLEQALFGGAGCVILSGADIFVSTVGGTPAVYVSAATLGLDMRDNVDALALSDNGDGVFDPPWTEYISLSAAAPPRLAPLTAHLV